MRFAASFGDTTREIIHHMVSGISKLNDAQLCALVFTDEKGMEVRAVTDSTSAFGKVDTQQFLSFRVQSKSGNVIACEVSLTSVQAAFSDTSGAEEVQMKLTKNAKQEVFLTLTTRTITQRTIVQDVPVVNLLQPSELSRYEEPPSGDPKNTAAVFFPDAKAAKKVLDRMKQLDKFVQVKADEEHGTLVFRVDTEVVSTRTTFHGLRINPPTAVEPEPAQPSGNKFVAAALSAKELAAIVSALNGFGKRAVSTLIAIVRGHVVCLHVNFDDESILTFYLATAACEDDLVPVLENRHLLRLETLRDEDSGEQNQQQEEEPDDPDSQTSL